MSYIDPIRNKSLYPGYYNPQAMQGNAGQNVSNTQNAGSNNAVNGYSQVASSNNDNQAVTPYSVMGSMAGQLFNSLSNIQYGDIINSVMNPIYGMFSGQAPVEAVSNDGSQNNAIDDQSQSGQVSPHHHHHHHSEASQMDGKVDGSGSDAAKTGQKAGGSKGGGGSDSDASAEINGITIYSGQTIDLGNGATATFDGQTLTVTTADGNTVTNEATQGEPLDIQVDTQTGSTTPDGNSQNNMTASMANMSSGVNSAINQNVNDPSIFRQQNYNPFV